MNCSPAWKKLISCGWKDKPEGEVSQNRGKQIPLGVGLDSAGSMDSRVIYDLCLDPNSTTYHL